MKHRVQSISNKHRIEAHLSYVLCFEPTSVKIYNQIFTFTIL